MYHFCYHTVIVSKGSGKIRHYFGKHSTKNLNDEYVGSGRIIRDILKSKKEFEITCTRSEFFETAKEAYEFEELLISEGREKYGDSVININGGGKGGQLGLKHSTETKAKISKSRKGQKFSEEAKAKMSGENHNKFKGWYITPAGKYESSRDAAIPNNCTYRTIQNRCKSNMEGYSFMPI
jgi:hypothetical protein